MQPYRIIAQTLRVPEFISIPHIDSSFTKIMPKGSIVLDTSAHTIWRLQASVLPSTTLSAATKVQFGILQNLSSVLSIGDTTGVNNISINSGQNLTFVSNGFQNRLNTLSLTSTRTISLPDSGGTIALLTDIPAVNNIYSNDGTLSSARILSMGFNNLTIKSAGLGKVVFEGTGNSGDIDLYDAAGALKTHLEAGATGFSYFSDKLAVGQSLGSSAATLDVLGLMRLTATGTETANYILKTDTTGLASWSDINTLITPAVTLYNGNGTLSSVRTVTMDTFNLGFNVTGLSNLLYLHALNGMVGVNVSPTLSLFQIQGKGASSATTSLLIRNSVSAENFKVLDDGQVSSLNGYWQGAAKILYVNPNGTTNNTLIGEGGGNAIMTGGGNTSLGSTSFITNTSGTNNVAIGYQSLYSNSVGADNVAIGMNSLLSNTSSYNIGIGVSSLQSNTTGTSNTSIGTLSLLSNISGNYNNAFGIESNRSNLIGSHNSSFGDYSLYSNLADNNTAMGSYALELNTTGANNIALGYQAGFYNTIQSNRL